MSAPKNPSAFPVSDGHCTNAGMDLRDWFAGQALAGMNRASLLRKDDDYETGARMSYKMADAMLKAREPQP